MGAGREDEKENLNHWKYKGEQFTGSGPDYHCKGDDNLVKSGSFSWPFHSQGNEEKGDRFE